MMLRQRASTTLACSMSAHRVRSGWHIPSSDPINLQIHPPHARYPEDDPKESFLRK